MAEEELKQRIADLEEELKNTKVNKRTEAAVGQLKAKIAKLKEELEEKLAKGGGKGEGFAVKKEGDATVGLLGKPSVGKSTLLGQITNKESKIGMYEFTTVDVVPGLLHHNHTNLQILDLPGIIDRASDNRGFGKKVLSVVRACDLVVLVIDARRPFEDMEMLLRETKRAGIRLNTIPPNIEIKKTHQGGIQVPLNNSENNLSYDLIQQIMHDLKLVNAEVIIHEKDVTVDDFIEACYKNMEYKNAIICINKIDLFSVEEMKQIKDNIEKQYGSYPIFGLSAENAINIEKFKDFVWDQLGFIWVYLKEQRKEADLEKPLVMRKGDTVKDVCTGIHKDMLRRFRYAKATGPSAKFPEQHVGLTHVVKHNDIIEIYVK